MADNFGSLYRISFCFSETEKILPTPEESVLGVYFKKPPLITQAHYAEVIFRGGVDIFRRLGVWTNSEGFTVEPPRFWASPLRDFSTASHELIDYPDEWSKVWICPGCKNSYYQYYDGGKSYRLQTQHLICPLCQTEFDQEVLLGVKIIDPWIIPSTPERV